MRQVPGTKAQSHFPLAITTTAILRLAPRRRILVRAPNIIFLDCTLLLSLIESSSALDRASTSPKPPQVEPRTYIHTYLRDDSILPSPSPDTRQVCTCPTSVDILPDIVPRFDQRTFDTALRQTDLLSSQSLSVTRL